MNLTETQRVIIADIEHSLLVTAPAGAGKTEVMARRAANAKSCGRDNILCLTFTNRAADSMRKRIRSLVPDGGITICTFHAFCSMLIRAESDTIGLPYDFIILDETDSADIIRDLLPSRTSAFSDHDIRAASSEMEAFRRAEALKDAFSAERSERFFSRFSIPLDTAVCAYQSALSDINAMDFQSLVLTAYAFLRVPEHIRRWRQAYDFIQVDEMQDTDIIEYDIISTLASLHKNLSLFGDIDQTIYEWRGSCPFEIVSRFEQTFAPIVFLLDQNFRSTGEITTCAESFLSCYFKTDPKAIAAVKENGEKPVVCFLKNKTYEKKQINQILMKIHAQGVSYRDMAVLTRTNQGAIDYSSAIADAGIPCYVIDENNFFRREEIKDVLCVLRLLLNNGDTASARRALTKHAKHIGEKTVSKILSSAAPIQLSDFIQYAYQDDADLLQVFLEYYAAGQLVVFDVESTGLDTDTDEIIEIAAARFGENGVLDEFHFYIKNSVPVGQSETVHGYSDDFLKKAGKPAEDVLRDFLGFAEGCILCGHNVTYDIALLKSMLSRLNISFPFPYLFFDTLSGAKRMLKGAENYRLGTLCAHFGIEEEPSHHAMDDVWATCELHDICLGFLIETKEARVEVYNEYHDMFKGFSALYKRLFEKSESLRPDALLSEAIDLLDIRSHYRAFPVKLENLNELICILKELDDPALSPKNSLRRIVEFLSLSSSIERQITEADKTAVLTVHQAKGLQFNTVIIANAVEGTGGFPSKMNKKYEKIDEEARLFYVAMTRACEHLFITLSAEDQNGAKNTSSPFIRCLPKSHYETRIQGQP